MTTPARRSRRSGRRRSPLVLVEIPIKLKLRAGLHDDVIDFFQSVPDGGRAGTVVTLARAYLSGGCAGIPLGRALQPDAAGEDEIYATLKDML